MQHNIGGRLAHARDLAGLSQRALAGLAMLDPSHVRLIEDGLRPDPAVSTATKLCAVLGLSLDWLCLGTGAPPTAESVGQSVRRTTERAERVRRRRTGTQ